jgi:hypothetical protein
MHQPHSKVIDNETEKKRLKSTQPLIDSYIISYAYLNVRFRCVYNTMKFA